MDEGFLQLANQNVGLILATGAVLLATSYIVRWQVRAAQEKAVVYSVEAPKQADPAWKGTFIDKPTLKVHGSNLVNCYDPSTGYSLGHVLPASAGDIDQAISSAAGAQASWARTTFAERRRVLNTLTRFVLDNQLAIGRVCARDSGKPLLDAALGEILVTVEKLRWVARHGEAALAPTRRPTNLLLSYKRNTVRYEPMGVVAACVSWNYPFHNFISPVIAALFAGNAVVVKPSERTAWSSTYFLHIVRGALSACGHDPNLVHSLVLWPQDADRLTSHPGISHITFIGSQPVAKEVARSASAALTPVCAELGGKDPAIVLDDIDSLERVGEIILRGTFISAGQNCIGVERVIATPKIHDRLVEFLHNKIKTFRLGSGISDTEEVDMGAMISGDRMAHLEAVIEDARKKGAMVVAGGKRYEHPRWPKGHYFSPTLITEVTSDMDIAQEELFAPVCAVMRADSVSHAIEIANSTPFALGSSVFGTNPAELEKVVVGVKAGMVAVNDFGSFYAVQMPFGGAKGSGYGRFAGAEGLQSLCNIKAVSEDAWPFAKTTIPPVYQYPVQCSRAWEVSTGVFRLGYGLSLREQAAGLWRLLSNISRSQSSKG